MKDSTITIACLGFLLGVAGYFLFGMVGTIVVAVCGSVVLFFMKSRIQEVRIKNTRSKRLRFLFSILSFFILTILGFLYSRHFDSVHQSKLPENLFDTAQTVVGFVTGDPDIGLTRTQVIIKPMIVGEDSISREIPDRILITLPAKSIVSHGDVISVSTKLETPDTFTTDSGREFDYPHYLALHDIFATMHPKNFKILSSHKSFVKILFSLKRAFVGTIVKLFPSPESGLFAGIVIGEKSLLPANNLSDFQIAGLTHMIVLSGYNITVVALFMMTAFAWIGLGYRARRVGALIAIPLFVVMTGLGASSVRAAIMSMIVIVLQMTTRPVSVTRVILITLVAMIIVNPRALIWDPSLHLSFLAFFGLAYCSPIVAKWFSRLPEFAGLRDLAAETIGVQIIVLPYLIWMSGSSSILLFLANFLTVPLTPLVMATGFFATMVGMISVTLGKIFAFPVKIVLSYFLSVAHLVASVQFLKFTIPPFAAWWMAGIYFVLICFLVWNVRNQEKKKPR